MKSLVVSVWAGFFIKISLAFDSVPSFSFFSFRLYECTEKFIQGVGLAFSLHDPKILVLLRFLLSRQKNIRNQKAKRRIVYNAALRSVEESECQIM